MIRLSDTQIDMMKDHARKAFPNEACGFLVGTQKENERRVTRIVPCRNMASMPVQRFELDSDMHIKLQRECREAGLDILGCYHSHPKGPALPSAEDLRRAVIPHWVWLIIGEAEGKPLSLRAFVLDGASEHQKQFAPLAVSVDSLVA